MVFVFKKGQITASGKPEDIFKMENILTDSNLQIPLELQLYKEVCDDEILKKDKQLIEALWQLGLMK